MNFAFSMLGDNGMADVIQVIEDVKKYDKDADESLITGIFRELGAVVYNRNTRYIDCTDPFDRMQLREHFLKKKLGLQLNDDALNEAIDKTCIIMKDANPRLRATFCYLLVKRFSKEALF